MNGTEIIGLTGGIGSGKSTAASYLAARGIPVLDADRYARRALDPGTDSYDQTIGLFGASVVREDGTLRRDRIAAIVFDDAALRARLNGIVHPFVLRQMLRDTAALKAKRVVWEVPLLFESGFDAYCDRTVAITCGEAVRTARIMARDGMTAEQAMARIRAQMTDEQRAARATDTVANDGDEQALRAKLDALLAAWEGTV